ncbi:MAG TPA: amylo-alpha-1,6-glucosidase [Casimicrobiaceae bacterium]|nr:amylo-alpha-1,6-glucosidase [Casimicrobiaceae bacterium]
MPDNESQPDVQVRGVIGAYSLKHDETFLVADSLGNVVGASDGLFRDDTRVLSRFIMSVAGVLPALLTSGVSNDNVFFRANLTNRPLPQLGGQSTPEGVIHIERRRFIWQARVYERVALTNYGEHDVPVPLHLALDVDFADIFEVRGQRRARRGERLPGEVAPDHVAFRYAGLDGIERHSCVAFSMPAKHLDQHSAMFDFTMPRHERAELYIEIGPAYDGPPGAQRFRHAAALARLHMRSKRRRAAAVRTSNRSLNLWIDRSRSDLALLETDLATGPYPFAGIPWFSTPFGRDGIITAMQVLWLDPALARGVLRFLAHHQAHAFSSFADAAPGKIMHETRKGEMARLGEVPFANYYGGVDTTPLFVMLAGAYAQRTADLALIEEIWPALHEAMEWVEGAGDSNRDGLVDYARGEKTGLANQGWKDSVDSVFHADGSFPPGPIALVEVQGYVYAARLAMADLAARRGDRAAQQTWRQRATRLREAIEERFWMPEQKYYGIAIDGHGELCRVRASNAGHLLYCGVPAARRASAVIEQLVSAALDNGWGVRTLAERAARFNPMSYHDGSVWPHDTGICAAGMARYGERDCAKHLLSEMFAAAHHFGMRLPELFCGFARVTGEPPVGYPVACLPQAWSSGAVFMMLQACLGLRVDAFRREIEIARPDLPDDIERLTIRGLGVGEERVDLVFQRMGECVAASPLGRLPRSVRVVTRL